MEQQGNAKGLETSQDQILGGVTSVRVLKVLELFPAHWIWCPLLLILAFGRSRQKDSGEGQLKATVLGQPCLVFYVNKLKRRESQFIKFQLGGGGTGL